MSNGIANIIASLIIAGAIVGTSVFEKDNSAGSSKGEATTDKEFSDWYARAVGDIRNDIVVNCGCCGDDGVRSSTKSAKRTPTRTF